MNFSLCENRFNSNSSDSPVVMKPFATLYLVPTSPHASYTILPKKKKKTTSIGLSYWKFARFLGHTYTVKAYSM